MTLRTHRIYADSQFLDPLTCRRIRAAFDRGTSEPAEVLRGDVTVDRTARVARSIEVDCDTIADVEQQLEARRDAIADFFALTLGEREGVGFLRYEPGGFYKPHRDRGVLPSWPGAARRRISVVVFLNSAREAVPGADFSGGALRLAGPRSQPLEILPRQGWLIAFPATVLHEVALVHSGTRDVLVDWFY